MKWQALDHTAFMAFMTLERWQQAALTLARMGVLGMAISMPVSRAAFNISALLMLIGWALSGHWALKWACLRHNLPALACVAFFGVALLALITSTAALKESGGQLLAYSRILYVPIVVTLLTDKVWYQRVWKALVAGMLFTLGVFLLDIYFEVPGTVGYGTHTAGVGVFHHHIAQGMVLSFLGAYALHQVFVGRERWLQGLWLVVVLANAAGMIFVNVSRTGQLSLIFASMVVMVLYVPRRFKLFTMAACAVLGLALAVASPHMRDRFAVAWSEVTSFQQDGEFTSVGGRLKAWEFAGTLIEAAPWLGHGTGSYKPLAHQHFEGSPICRLGVCEQPHNQFLLTAVEGGLPMVLALLGLLAATAWRGLVPLHPNERLLLPFVSLFVITAMFDSSLMIQAQAFFAVTALGLLLASRAPSVLNNPLDNP